MPLKGAEVPTKTTPAAGEPADRGNRVSRARLIALLNEDLAREYQAIIAKQIDYLGGDPTVIPNKVETSDKAEARIRRT